MKAFIRPPKGYRHAGTMDFVRNRRQLLTVNISALVIAALMVVGGLIYRPPLPAVAFMARRWWLWIALGAALLAYIPLHELTHGALMHALSGVRPKYGFHLAYAYAGSDVWFDRGAHILIALAPVVLWGLVFQALILALPDVWFWPLWALQISNVSGSAGDLYCAVALWRMSGALLIRDTGTRMTIMRRVDPPSTGQ